MADASRTIFFVLLYISIPLLVWQVLSYVGVSFRRFSIPSFFVIAYLVFAYLGLLPLYFGWDEYALSLGVSDPTILFLMLLYSGGAILCVVGGFAWMRFVVGLRPEPAHPREPRPARRRQLLFLTGLTVVCVAVLAAYLAQVREIAMFRALVGDTAGAAVARSEMGNAFAGKYWRYQMFFRTLLDYCAVAFFAEWLISRRRIAGLLFAGTMAAATFSATMATEKAPFLNLLLMLYLAYVLCHGARYWQRGLKYFAPAAVGMGLLLYVGLMGAPDVASALRFLSGRVLTGQIMPAYFYLAVFPSHVGYLMGRSFPNPGGLLPFQPYDLTHQVEHFIKPENAANGIVGSAPTVFWAEMYANFGPTGILLSAFAVGAALVLVSYVLSRWPLTAPVCAATASLALHYMTLTATSLSDYFIDLKLLVIGSVTFITILLGRRRVVPARAG